MIRKILPLAKKYSFFGILSALSIAIEVAIEVRIPFLLSKIINNGIMGNDFELVKTLGLKMILMAIISLFFGMLASRFSALFGTGFGFECRKALFARIQDFAFSNIDKFGTPSLITRLTSDTNMLQIVFMMVVRICVRAPLMFVMAIIYAVKINTRLSAVFLLVAPVMAISIILIGRAAHPRFRRMFEKYDGFNLSIQENLAAVRVVKAFVRARHEKEKFEASNNELREASIFAEKLIILNGPIMSVSMYSSIVVIILLGSRLIVRGLLAVGDLSAIISYVSQILMSLMMISMILVMSVMAKASLNRIGEVLDEIPAISDDAADKSLRVENGSIEMKNVCFKYSLEAERNVLHNINVKINSGETIGIIGGTGSAKTTLVQLIPRLYDVTSGEIFVGGHPIKEYTLENLRNSVSMVLQNNVLFSGTIGDNLLWGDENASDEEIEKACETAQALSFIRSFPDGFDTDLGQGGVNLSGGQKQRLTIARALLKKPKILILDDSTSAIDTVTDKALRDALNKQKDITRIIIAQRIASVTDADRIIVLDDGKINGIGTHSQLLKENEIYKEVYLSQQEGANKNGAA
ncbi:MAG: putative ABC transporter ATP-binding protein [Firmicutes bacterium ADurb.Bin300]|nr:MAG: putative ABC transporter ATP-binding protein [Firmicutes bacterium ADurb.Bin300]